MSQQACPTDDLFIDPLMSTPGAADGPTYRSQRVARREALRGVGLSKSVGQEKASQKRCQPLSTRHQQTEPWHPSGGWDMCTCALPAKGQLNFLEHCGAFGIHTLRLQFASEHKRRFDGLFGFGGCLPQGLGSGLTV